MLGVARVATVRTAYAHDAHRRKIDWVGFAGTGFAAYTWLAAPLLASLETPVPPHIALARMGQGFLGIVLACWIGVVAQSFGRGPMVGSVGFSGCFALAVIAAYALEVQVPIGVVGGHVRCTGHGPRGDRLLGRQRVR